jgi:hypothetical protein
MIQESVSPNGEKNPYDIATNIAAMPIAIELASVSLVIVD